MKKIKYAVYKKIKYAVYKMISLYSIIISETVYSGTVCRAARISMPGAARCAALRTADGEQHAAQVRRATGCSTLKT